VVLEEEASDCDSAAESPLDEVKQRLSPCWYSIQAHDEKDGAILPSNRQPSGMRQNCERSHILLSAPSEMQTA